MTDAGPTSEMAKAYDPSSVEAGIYEMWLRGGYFRPRRPELKVESGKLKGDPSRASGRTDEGEPFCIIMPPPNVTGELHLGHALTATVEDCLIRWHRMRGEPTLWLPGVDHAGIATQNVVERELAKEGMSRHDLGREKVVERVWRWVRE